MNMSFGDWELFRAMVETLRDDNPSDMGRYFQSGHYEEPGIKHFTQDKTFSGHGNVIY